MISNADAQETVGRVRLQHAIVGNAVREHILDRYLERDREEIEAGEHVLAGGAARTGNAAEIVAIQVDEIEQAFLVELVRIVELAGDDPGAVGERVYEPVYERLIVEADLAARGIARVVSRERLRARR